MVDAQFNALLYEFTSGPGVYFQNEGYIGAADEVVFSNGSNGTFSNYAFTDQDFTGVDSGEAFYSSFCNATAKMVGVTHSSFVAIPTTSPDVVDSKFKDPEPVVLSPDGVVAGYLLDGIGYNKIAVLSISNEAGDAFGSPEAVAGFLVVCRNASMKKLILDVSPNPRGSLRLSFDFFKQVCMSLESRCENRRCQS